MTNLVITMQAAELCQRALEANIEDQDARSLLSYLVSQGFHNKSLFLPDKVAESYSKLVDLYGLHYIVNARGKQM